MNTETDIGKGGNLQGAFGDRGTNVNSFKYGHPYAEEIVKRAKEVLCESDTGRVLVAVLNKYQVPVHVMKGKILDGTGFSPEMRTIFLSIPGNVQSINGDILLNFAKALREVDLEYAGKKTPDPSKDLIKYAAFVHARNVEALRTTCEVVKELTNSSHFSVLLDSLAKLGLNSFYKAFLEGASKEELYDYYAEAYDTTRRSI